MSWPAGVWAPVATGAMYFIAAKVGAWLAFPSAPVSAFWAPNAILLAALVLLPRERWSIALLAILPFHLLAQLPGSPPAQVLIQYLLNCAEALIGAFAIVAFCPQPLRYDRVRTAFVLIAFGGIIAPLVTSVLMAGAFVAIGLSTSSGSRWSHARSRIPLRWVALVPLIVHGMEWLRRGPREFALERAIEACALGISLTAIGIWVFVLPAEGPPQCARAAVCAAADTRVGGRPLRRARRLRGPHSCWVRYPPGGVINGHGPFTAQHPVQNALSVVSFQVVACVALVAFAAVLEEWRHGARALSDSEVRFRNIFESNIIPTVLWRDDFRVSEVNDAFLRLTGFSQADIDNGCLRIDELTSGSRGSGVADALHPDPLRRFDATEKELTLRDGRRIPVILGQCRFSSGEPGGILYALDLSAFRRAEAQRLKAENLHSAVLASVHDQIAVLDSAGTIIEVNDSWRRFVEAAPSSSFDRVLAGENFLSACARAAEHGDAAAANQLSAVRAVLDGAEIRRQLEFTSSADGQSLFEVSVERLRRHEGGAVVTRTDITARKQAEIEARNQRQQLAHLGRAAVLGELSGAFAHELNQPLTSILGNAEAALRLLEQGSDTAEVAEILRDIVHDDERAAQVIQGLRALLHKGETQRQFVDLNAVVREVIDLAGSELITRNVRVSTELDTSAPHVMADRVQMQQVVLNLLMNGSEAMAGMPVADRRVRVGTRFDAQRAAVEVTVADSGSGIARGDIDRIFQPFVTTKAHGMGLGLAICRSVAESHHGRLWAENGEQGGAIFHLVVPIEG
jgi:PAS domain S-box-containing protein